MERLMLGVGWISKVEVSSVSAPTEFLWLRLPLVGVLS
jgi:hypothetical protein